MPGILLGFSKHGGWIAAAPLHLWGTTMLLVAAAQLSDSRNWGAALMSLLAGVCAIAAAAMQQRERERDQPKV